MQEFRRIVWAHYKKHRRHTLPWRTPSLLLRQRLRTDTVKLRKGKENDVVYKILVSEVMLQQTQVERVIPFYKKFIQKFPTPARLASAPLSPVLQMWQGLGYNRRAKLLHSAAKELQHVSFPSHRTKLICADIIQKLEALPGVGPYTARAIAAFAFNQDVIFIETNIRTAIIHHFFSRRSDVEDTELVEVLQRLLPKGRSREWYSALMDYGAHLKRSGISLNAKSAHYNKQSKFSGSSREARGAILRALPLKDASRASLINLLGVSRRAQLVSALSALRREGLVTMENGRYTLPD